MVQATVAVVAVALTVIAMSVQAAPAPTCEQIREHAKQYTMAQIRAMAKRAGLTAEQWAAVRECLKDKR